MKPLRIAQIAPLCESIPPKTYGGTERIVYYLSRGLVELGHDVTVFCSGDSKPPGRHFAVWPDSLRLSNRKIEDFFAYQTRMIGSVARHAHEFDIIHNHYDYPLLPLTLLADTPMVTTMHGRMDLPDLGPAIENFPAAPLVSISSAQQKPLPYLNWVASISHGIDISSFKFEEKPGRYLAFLGRFSPEKRPEWAIEIAKRSGIPLKMAAKVEKKDLAYYETCVKPHIDGRFIEYIGEIGEREKSEFLGSALALVFPIDWPEPFGLVLIESFACGTPVLARPFGSVPELLEEGITGFSRTDIQELSRLAEQAAKLDRRRIRNRAVQRFSIERMAQEYLHVYRRLIQGDRSDRKRGDREPSKINGKQADSGRVAEYRWDIVHPVNDAAHRDSQGLP